MKHIRTIAIALVVLLVLGYGAAITAVLPKTSIPVLSHDVAAGTKIVAADVTSISWPANGTGGVITSESGVIGLVTAVLVRAGEPLTSSEFIGAQSSGQPIGRFPWAIPEDAGKLPVPFPVSPNQMGGAISSGDYVDIVTGDPEPARILIQRVHVIEADNAGGLPMVPNSVALPGVAPEVPVKLVLALSADQYSVLFPLPPHWANLRFLYVTITTPCIPGIPSGSVGSDNCSASLPAAATPGATPTPAATPAPTPPTPPTPRSVATPAGSEAPFSVATPPAAAASPSKR